MDQADDEDEDDIERFVRNGIRRVRLEDEADARSRHHGSPTPARPHAPTHTRPPSYPAPQPPRSPNASLPAPVHAQVPPVVTAAPPRHAPSALGTRLPRTPTSPARHVRFCDLPEPPAEPPFLQLSPTTKVYAIFGVLILFAALAAYVFKVRFKNIAMKVSVPALPIEYCIAAICLLLVFLLIYSMRNIFLGKPKKASVPSDPVKLLQFEKEKLKKDLAVLLDRQYSYWHYTNYHHSIESISVDIEATTRSMQQIETLISMVETGNGQREHRKALQEILDKFGVE